MLDWSAAAQANALLAGTAGLLSARPLASTPGLTPYYLATDDASGVGLVYKSDGSNWSVVTGIPPWAQYLTPTGAQYILALGIFWVATISSGSTKLVDASGNPIGTAINPVYTSPGALTPANDGVSADLKISGTDVATNVGAPSAQTVRTVESTILTYTNFGAATGDRKANIKGSAGTIMQLVAINRNAAVRYIQVHNKATAPAATEVPILSFPIPAGTTDNPGSVVLGIPDLRRAFSTGIGFAISTTEATFTDSATASDHSVSVGYL